RAGDDGERRERRQPAPFPGGRPGDRAHHEEAAVGRLLLPVQLLERLQDQAQDEPPLSRGRGYWLRLYRVMSVRAPMTPSAARSASCWKRATAPARSGSCAGYPSPARAWRTQALIRCGSAPGARASKSSQRNTAWRVQRRSTSARGTRSEAPSAATTAWAPY